MVKGFSKMYNLSFFGHLFLLTFLQYNWQNCTFFADYKIRAQELFNDVSFVIFGHQTWNLEGGGSQIDVLDNTFFKRMKIAVFLYHIL